MSSTIVALEPVGSRVIEPRIDSMRSQGRHVIPVHGYPMVQPPEHVLAALKEAGRRSGGSPSAGLLELRQSLARALDEQYGSAVDPGQEILITCGAMHGLRIAFTTLLEPGDEAILITPCYFFSGLIELAGANVVRVETHPSDGYMLDFCRIRKAITPQTKLLVLSSPVNPTGYVYSRDDVERFIAIAEEFDLLLVSDESYDRMIFDGLRHISPFHYPEGRRRTVLVKSFTKSYSLPSWRVGYIAADAALLPYFRKVLEWNLLYCPYVNQKVALAALDGPQEWLLDTFAEIGRNRDMLMTGLAGATGYEWVTPRGGPFVFVNVCGETGDEAAIAEHLLEDFGVPAVPGRHFEKAGWVRIPYSGSQKAVEDLVSSLVEASRMAVT